MNICFVVNIYPSELKPSYGIFVQRLVFALRDQGHEVSVVHPLPVTTEPRYAALPYYSEETTLKGNTVPVYRPKAISLGQAHSVLGKSPVKITTKFFVAAAKRVIKKENLCPDGFYGHFLAPSGVAVARLGREFDLPSFCAFGESYPSIEQFGAQAAKDELMTLSGAIAVSSHLSRYLLKFDVLPEDKITIIPNGFNPDEFGPGDKVQARKALGLPKDAFIAGYVGWLNERKGVNRLEEAFEDIDNAYFMCAGTGPLVPKSDKCLFAHHIDGSDLKTFYNALDVFVLPTLSEGCSNAIVEAVACGLPVVSSDLPFNYEILDSRNSILVDPMNVNQIRGAIEELKGDEQLREKLSRGSLDKAKNLTLEERARKIDAFIESRL